MAMPMTEEQVFANIGSPFHTEFKKLRQTHLQPDENIFAAANCSVDDFFGFFLVTTYRAILVCFRADRKRQRIRYYKEGGGFFSSTIPDERFWFALSSTPLSESELKTRVVQDALLSSIVRVERKNILSSLENNNFKLLNLIIKGVVVVQMAGLGRLGCGTWPLTQKMVKPSTA